MKDPEGPVRAALFDVDGTLVDTNYLYAVTWWGGVAQAGHVVPMAEIHRAIGMGSGLMLDKLLPQDRNTGDDADIRAASPPPPSAPGTAGTALARLAASRGGTAATASVTWPGWS